MYDRQEHIKSLVTQASLLQLAEYLGREYLEEQATDFLDDWDEIDDFKETLRQDSEKEMKARMERVESEPDADYDGIYLRLFHGREDPNVDMDDWGLNGPIFGPFHFVHTVYGQRICLPDDRQLFIRPDGLVYYDGVYYGDWSAFKARNMRPVEFDQSKAGEPVPEQPAVPLATCEGLLSAADELSTHLRDFKMDVAGRIRCVTRKQN